MTRPAAVSLAAFFALAFAGGALAQSQVDPAPSPSPAPGARPDTPPPATQQYKAMDRNSDGLVSTGEFEDVARSMFDAMDADKDDDVTLEEMQAARQRVSGRVNIGPGVAARKIRELDTSDDGVLSRTEHRDAASLMFREADADNDGNLTTQEFETRYAEVLAGLAP